MQIKEYSLASGLQIRIFATKKTRTAIPIEVLAVILTNLTYEKSIQEKY